MEGAGGTTVISAGHVGHARGDLLDHVRMIRDASGCLYRDGNHAPASFFAIVCMEEIAKYHVLAACGGRGRGVTGEDTRPLASHVGRIAAFLRGSGGAADCHGAAERLDLVRRLAVRHGFLDGGVVTLEGALGMERMRRVSAHLQEIVAAGIARLGRPEGRARGGDGLGPRLAEVMELTGEVPDGRIFGGGDAVPADGLAPALQSLEDHVGVLGKFAADLHDRGHYEASILMSILSFEEAGRHYVLARHRRQGNGAEGGTAGAPPPHGDKLSAFLGDVSRYLGDKSVSAHSKPPGRYAIIRPGEFPGLGGAKRLAVSFDHVGGRTMTLGKLLGGAAGGVSSYLRETLAGMASWAIVCDGDSENPYRRHDASPVHHRRYRDLVRLKTGPGDEERDREMSWIVGRLDRLGAAVGRRDAGGCEAELSRLRERV